MKHMKTVVIPESTRDVVDFVTCDLCKNKIDDNYSNYSAEETEVRHKRGAAYPEGGNGTETTFDICGQCFDEKLTPWMEANGATPATREWDY